MPKLSRKVDSSSNTVYIRIMAYSTSTVPLQPKTGLSHTSFSLTQGAYVRNRGSAVTFSLTTIANATAAFAAGAFFEVNSINFPGLYRLDIPDAAFASGSPFVIVGLRPATAANSPIDLEIELTGWDNTDAVRGGLTALPNNTNLAAMYAAFEAGQAQAGGASSITLRSGASSTTDIYKDQAIHIVSGTGSGQTNRITAYDGTTKVATVSTAWATPPASGSNYVVLGRIG